MWTITLTDGSSFPAGECREAPSTVTEPPTSTEAPTGTPTPPIPTE